MGRHWHTEAQIAAKLEKADALFAEGRLHGDIAKQLGISVMTYHRWRKTRESSQLAGRARPGRAEPDGRISELQLENSRLRHLLTNLLLEKMNIEEAIHGHSAEVSRFHSAMRPALLAGR